MNQSDHKGEQIPLQFHHYEALNLEQFIVGKNAEALATIQTIIQQEELKPLYLWGNSSCGKSHLLQAACEKAASNGQSVAYLPMEILINNSHEILEGLENQHLICIDDLHHVNGNQEWQTALFHLYNRIQENQHCLIMSSNESPINTNIELADLKSRLSWGLTNYLEELNDQEKVILLKQKAKQRAFELTDEVAEFLLSRVDRNLNHLLSLLEKIDQHSLSQKRKITIPFVKTLL